MSDPRINPNYRGVKCPGCGERLPSLLTNLCSYCQHQKDKAEIKRLEADNTLLQVAAKRADNIEKHRDELHTENEQLRTANKALRAWRDRQHTEDAG